VTEVILFHSALGQTEGFLAFADALRAAGHKVHTPDLYDGAVFSDLDEGVALAESLGMGVIVRKADAAVAKLPKKVVYAGFSLGSLAAQSLAQTRKGARGALLYHGGTDPKWFPKPWPQGLPAQIHFAQDDPWIERDEIDALVAASGAEVFIYPGAAHLFADPSGAEFDPEASEVLMERTRAFLH
jgi:dienelactone hydrolase